VYVYELFELHCLRFYKQTKFIKQFFCIARYLTLSLVAGGGLLSSSFLLVCLFICLLPVCLRSISLL
jgi:hypothetical protein